MPAPSLPQGTLCLKPEGLALDWSWPVWDRGQEPGTGLESDLPVASPGGFLEQVSRRWGP